MLKRKFQQPGDVQVALGQLFKSNGIEIADELSIDHINDSIRNLEEIQYIDPQT